MASLFFGKSLLLLRLRLLLQLSLLAFLAGAASISEIGGLGGDAVGVSRHREFDYFALALQWPATYCGKTRNCCSRNACCWGGDSPTEFTIHGLWPDYNNGGWPSCCYRSDFDEKEISTLTDALKKYWPTLSCSSPSSCHGRKGSFWGHEWEKHGTCSFPVIRDEYSYFITGLNLYFKYNVTSVLYEAGYVPSNDEKYPFGGIVSAIENAFHTTPKVVCKSGAIEEIHICFYKDFKTRDCDASNSCPKYVSLPAYTSLGHEGAEARVLRMPGHGAL